MIGGAKFNSIVAAALVLSLAMETSARAGDLVQERQYLRVKIGGKDVRLEALFVKRADAKGRLPIVFFNHGRPAYREMSLDQSLLVDDPGINLMADMARPGRVVGADHPPGFGLSHGPGPAELPRAFDGYLSGVKGHPRHIQNSVGRGSERGQ